MNILKRFLNKFCIRKKTHMECEIFEQPDIIRELIKKYLNKDNSINIKIPPDIKKIVLFGSGSSFHAGSIAAEFIKYRAGIDAEAFYSSETALNENFKTDNETLYIFISQSGETGDTNLVLEKIKKISDKTFAVTNSKNSKLYRNAEYKMYAYAGAEKAVSSTKAVSSQLFCLLLLAVKLMQIKNIPSEKFINELVQIPEYTEKAIEMKAHIKKSAEILADYSTAAVLASGMFYPLAMEGALKIKETSYIYASAYPSGEFMHGHIAALNKNCAVILIVNSLNLEYTIDILMKINSSYKTHVIIISSAPALESDKNDFIHIETESPLQFLFSSLIVLQLLALETASLLKRNADAPKGLTKVVK